MGKGTIQSHLGDGLYDLQINFNRDRALAQKAKLEERYDELRYDIIPDLEDERDETETALNEAETGLNEAIEASTEDMDQYLADIEAAQGIYLEALEAYGLAANKLTDAKLELESISAKIQSLSNIPATDSLTAWCADLTTNLSGEVGTVEVPGERQHVLIRPGYNGAAVYDAARDGQIFPIMSTTPASTFYNLAMMPGWQKWRPQYRLGEITALDTENNTCSVELDEEQSSAQELDVNQASTLSGIPIEYMTCNSAAFEVGDRVLIEFTDWDSEQARVIGFENEPKSCAAYIKVKINGQDVSKQNHMCINFFDEYFEPFFPNWWGTYENDQEDGDQGLFNLQYFEKNFDITLEQILNGYVGLFYKNYDEDTLFDCFFEVTEENSDFVLFCGEETLDSGQKVFHIDKSTNGPPYSIPNYATDYKYLKRAKYKKEFSTKIKGLPTEKVIDPWGNQREAYIINFYDFVLPTYETKRYGIRAVLQGDSPYEVTGGEIFSGNGNYWTDITEKNVRDSKYTGMFDDGNPYPTSFCPPLTIMYQDPNCYGSKNEPKEYGLEDGTIIARLRDIFSSLPSIEDLVTFSDENGYNISRRNVIISISYECTSHSRWWYRKEYGYYCSIDACYPTNELGNYVLVESLEGSCPDSPYFSISEEGYIKWQTRDTPSERF